MPRPPNFNVESEIDAEGRIEFQLSGELNMLNTPFAKTKIKSLLNEENITGCSFNLSGLSFIDSSGLGMLYFFEKMLRNKGLRLELCAVPDAILRVMKLGSMHQIFIIRD